jgi:DNA-binding GntR family transcriptional regulator
MSEPKYERVARAIREQIRAGTLKPGDQLPSTAELRALYGVGAGAVREAVMLLVREGLIVTQPGEGRYVADPVPPPT